MIGNVVHYGGRNSAGYAGSRSFSFKGRDGANRGNGTTSYGNGNYGFDNRNGNYRPNGNTSYTHGNYNSFGNRNSSTSFGGSRSGGAGFGGGSRSGGGSFGGGARSGGGSFGGRR